jgi:hypothetical protein
MSAFSFFIRVFPRSCSPTRTRRRHLPGGSGPVPKRFVVNAGLLERAAPVLPGREPARPEQCREWLALQCGHHRRDVHRVCQRPPGHHHRALLLQHQSQRCVRSSLLVCALILCLLGVSIRALGLPRTISHMHAQTPASTSPAPRRGTSASTRPAAARMASASTASSPTALPAPSACAPLASALVRLCALVCACLCLLVQHECPMARATKSLIVSQTRVPALRAAPAQTARTLFALCRVRGACVWIAPRATAGTPAAARSRLCRGTPSMPRISSASSPTLCAPPARTFAALPSSISPAARWPRPHSSPVSTTCALASWTAPLLPSATAPPRALLACACPLCPRRPARSATTATAKPAAMCAAAAALARASVSALPLCFSFAAVCLQVKIPHATRFFHLYLFLSLFLSFFLSLFLSFLLSFFLSYFLSFRSLSHSRALSRQHRSLPARLAGGAGLLECAPPRLLWRVCCCCVNVPARRCLFCRHNNDPLHGADHHRPARAGLLYIHRHRPRCVSLVHLPVSCAFACDTICSTRCLFYISHVCLSSDTHADATPPPLSFD